MKLPTDVRQLLQRHFDNRHQDWLAGAGNWPLDVPLGIPSEQLALAQLGATRAWVSSWQSWQGAGTLQWTERRWRTLGTQRLPEALRLDGPAQVASWLGANERWECAASRHAHLMARWPLLPPRVGKLFTVLADYPEADFERLIAAVHWLVEHPGCGLYLRQLPIPGLDTKWIESRRSVLAELVCGASGRADSELDLHALCGLRRAPVLVRMRILDPDFRRQVGGIGDLTAPIEDLARLELNPAHVLIVENLQTGLALEDLDGTVAFLALGYGVDLLTNLPWIRLADCVYWGDIDTHGFAILNRARSFLPDLRSLLMDEKTLLNHRPLWTREPSQHGAQEFPNLAPDEQALYRGLKTHMWAPSVRLEQERIPWPEAMEALSTALAAP